MNAHHGWRRDTREPAVALPPLSCDCAVHVFDPARVDLLLPGRRYEPPVAWLDELRTLHERLGVQRAVLVQPSVYGNDHAVLLTALRADQARYRGVALLDDSVSDAACEELHAAGVRSARFNILSRFGAAFDTTAFRRQVRRAEALGWSISLHATADELAAHARLLLDIRAEVVVDHLAYLNPGDLDGEGFRFLREAVTRGHWWMKVSRVDHRFAPPYDDAVELIRRVVALNPWRMLWATDWPHPLYDVATTTMPNDADLIELLARAVPDAALREQILVHNPARVFGFPDA
ncbi:MAG: amidohydrolase family protein [Hydrogenophaga sp.]|uniref:amidohydrolase family protein n=1 Tax=Hydrogenophaga sp. TaxID=1904254 RepID=UPI004036AA77